MMGKHYGRLPTGATPIERFMAKVVKDAASGCWLWMGCKSDGYGRFQAAPKRPVIAHRWSYQHHVGPIPDGLQLDHLCRIPACVNPEHLEPVTPAENVRRGVKAQMTHCRQGHPLAGENLQIHRDAQGYEHRRCRECNRVKCAAYNAELRRRAGRAA